MKNTTSTLKKQNNILSSEKEDEIITLSSGKKIRSLAKKMKDIDEYNKKIISNRS